MDSSLTHAKIFVTEDLYSKVSVDGQPHGVMTIVACVGGVIAACIILAVLTSMTECRVIRRAKKAKLQISQNKDIEDLTQTSKIAIINGQATRTSSMSTISVGGHSNASSKNSDICTCNGNKIGKECKRAISLESQCSVSDRSSVNSQQSSDEQPIVHNSQPTIIIKKRKQKEATETSCKCIGKSAEKKCKRINSRTKFEGKVNFAFENEKSNNSTTKRIEKIELHSQISKMTDALNNSPTSIEIERF